MFLDDNEISGVGPSVHVEADMSYSGAVGCQLMIAEGFQNDFALFKQVVASDVNESKLVRESAGEDEVAALQEGALEAYWERIKAFIKKIIAKVKGILTGFVAKLEAWMGKNGADFLRKYKREIYGKDVDGLKVRYSEPNANIADWSYKFDQFGEKMDIDKDTEHSDLVDEALSSALGSKTDKGDFRKDFHEKFFKDEEKDVEVTASNRSEMIQFIERKDPIAAIKKMLAAEEKGLTAYIKKADAIQKAATDKFVADKGIDKTDYYKDANGAQRPHKTSEMQGIAASYHKHIAALQEALGMINSAAMTEVKFAVAQSRRIAAAIVAYHGKSKKNEEADLIELAQESAEYDFYSEVE